MRLLDLFCGAGGAAVGYSRAGFTEIVGVDIKPQPRYPFTFVLGNALEYVGEHGRKFDAIHASPPCQRYSQFGNIVEARLGHRPEWPDSVPPTRKALKAAGRPFILENVVGAPIRHDLVLCGSLFGLGVRRHRIFEIEPPRIILRPPCDHRKRPIGVYGVKADGRRLWGTCYGEGNHPNLRAANSVEEARAVMGIDWMEWRELTEAIPPAYTEFIGRQLIQALRA